MLELRNVTKTVGAAEHIRDVSLTLRHGSLNVLLGPTLSGKTSLMRLMAGLDKPTSGAVFFDGQDVTGVPVQKRNVAMVYQQFINYPAMTVYENIASPLRVAGAAQSKIDAEVKRAAELLKLTPYLDRTPLNLSGDSSVTSRPSNSSLPCEGWISPEMMLSSVVLPQPDGPSNAYAPPSSKLWCTSFSAYTAFGPRLPP